ncbi:RNA 2',3'-cyclic phosphodiesterase [Candidatus Peregrinibacteria bacterium]|nr:RNA 2',3'-cyclic phosphodiesterase [Candidatus Peregrinibacteria bacterium]
MFVAIPLEGDAKRTFQELQQKLEPFADILRFQNPQSPHLTLQFWKEVMEIEYAPVVKKAEEIASRSHPFALQITGAETFGSRGEDRVLFLTVAFSPELAILKKLCPWPSEKPFAPHITLARIGHPQRFAVVKKKVMKILENCAFPTEIDQLRLYAEIEGRKQTVIGEFVFDGSKRPPP